MKRRILMVTVAAMTVLAMSATPAFALSMITNTFNMSDQTLTTGQKVTFTAKTVYGWQYAPNPYPSNFLTEVNSRHFGKPVTTSTSGISAPWLYKSTGRYVMPCWQVWQDGIGVLTTQTRWINFYAFATTAPSGDRRKHYHGQYDDGWDSTGIPVIRYTTHN